MILAVFSDIHSNFHALEACAAEAERRGADAWIFLGDYISDCALPHETLDLLRRAQRERPCFFIKGNREEYILSHHKNGSDWTFGSTSGSLLFTYQRLTAEDLEFIDSMPCMREINPNGKCPILMVHGSPAKSRDELRDGTYSIYHWLLQIEQPYMLGGHTHRSTIERVKNRTYVNPGSVGAHVMGAPESEMAFLTADGNTWQPELVRVPYDVDAAVRAIHETGLYDCSGIWGAAICAMLREGRNFPMFCLHRAAELAGEKPATQQHYEQAARDFGLI